MTHFLQKSTTYFVAALFVMLLYGCASSERIEIVPSPPTQNARVAANGLRVGYLWLDRGQMTTILQELRSSSHDTYYKNLTHLNLAFANPTTVSNTAVTVAITDDYGTVAANESTLKEITKLLIAKNPALRIGLSVAGAGASTAMFNTFATLLNNDTRRRLFAKALVSFAKNTGCHYIDMDIEWKGLTHTGYNTFAQLCYDTAKAAGVNFTLTLEYKYPSGLEYYGNGKLTKLSELVTKQTLQKCDLLKIMSYDYNSKSDLTIKNGVYEPNHAPIAIAERDIQYFIGQGVSADKIVLGLPFYGRKAFAGDVLGGLNQLSNMTADVQTINGTTSYFNGTTTIKVKLKLAQKYKIAGVMFWSVRSDHMATYSKSMLKVIVDNQNL